MSSHARRFGIGLSVCALAIAAGGTPAEETGYLRFDLTLDKGYLGPDGKAPPQPITVSLHCCGGRFNFGWAVMPGTTDFREVDARGLKIEGGRLAGQVKLVLDAHKGEYTYHDFDYEWIKGKRVPVYTYALEATRQGAELAGSWKGGWEVSGKTNALTGAAVKGRIWTHAQLAAAQAIAKGQDFPCHRGADGSASLPATGQEMVSSWDEARFVWRSEEYVPGAWSDGDFGGYAAPVIADGLIYMNYCEAEDDGAVLPFEGKQARWYGGHPARLKRRAFSAAWKDVLLCMDAATGMTVWKAEIPGGTDARHGNKKKGCHVPAAVWKDRVFVIGAATSYAYAFDAKTGRMLWQNDTLIRGCPLINASPQVADGVMVIAHGNKLFGLDAETGRRLWTTGHVLGGSGSPTRWVYQGKEYIIAVNTLIEPKTGKKLWSAAGAHVAATVGGNYLITGGDPKAGIGVYCYKITPEKAEPAWTLAIDELNNSGISVCPAGHWDCPVIYQGHAYIPLNHGKHKPLETPTDRNPKKLGGHAKSICVELATGNVVADGPRFSTASVGMDGLIISCVHNAGVGVLQASPAGISTLPGFATLYARDRFPTALVTSPCAADGRIYYRSKGFLFCYDLRKTPPSTPAGTPQARVGPPTEAADILKQLASRSRTAREAAVAATGALPEAERKSIAPKLAGLVGDGDWLTRSAAVAALERIAPQAAAAAGPLKAALAGSVRKRDLDAVALLADTLGEIEPGARKEAAGTLMEGLDDPSGTTRCRVVETLGGLGPDASAAVPKLVALLKESLAAHESAEGPLASLGKEVSDAVYLSRELVLALTRIGAPDEAVDLFVRGLASYEQLAEPCAQALGAMGERAVSAIPALVAQTRQRYNRTKQFSTRLVGEAAAKALCRMGAKANEAILEVAMHGEHGRGTAIAALMERGPERLEPYAAKVVPVLVQWLETRDPKAHGARRLAMELAPAFGPAAKPAVEPLTALLKEDVWKSARALLSLGQGGEETAVKALKEYYQSKETSGWNRNMITIVLSEHVADLGAQPKVQDEVIEFLMANQGRHPCVVVAGIASLPPEKARPLLERLAQSGNRHVAERARIALDWLGVEGRNRSVHSDPYWDAFKGKVSRGAR